MVTLETERHIEIFRHMGFRPEFLVAIFIHVRHLLNGRPAENSIVTHERSDITIGDGVFDSGINQVGEESDTVLEVRVDNLHNTGGELHNTNVGGLLHFRSGIKKTIRGNTSIGIDYRY